MSMRCIWCKDFDVLIEKINAPMILASVRAGRDLYAGKPFKFCPWCGHELHEVGSSPTQPGEPK